MTRRKGPPQGFATGLGLSVGLLALIAGGIADRGPLLPIVILLTAAVTVGLLTLLFPHGPLFTLGTANGLGMYACLYVVLARAGFPGVAGWVVAVAFMLPPAAFVLACWAGRHRLRRLAEADPFDLRHLPRLARWGTSVGGIGVAALTFPLNRFDPDEQGLALVGAMAAIGIISAGSVAEVVRLLVDVASILRGVSRRLAQLAVPIAAYTSLWAMLSVGFACLYRIADGLSDQPLFGTLEGPARLSFGDALHFSVVTLASVGYGDIHPIDDGVRILTAFEILLAQLLLLFGFYEIVRDVAPPGGRHEPRRRGDAGE